MKPRALPFLFALPALALLAAGCATTAPGTARTTEVDDVYFSSTDRITPRYEASAAAPAAYDPTAPPAADGAVANPDYTGQGATGAAGQQPSYYQGDSYTAVPRVTSPYYGSFNHYNSGYAYDPFWTGSSLAIGCGPTWGWGGPRFAYAPVYAGPRVRFGVSFGYGWGYSSWAAPMYGWAGPTFYDPFYDPFWGPSYYGYSYGWGYPSYGWGGGYGGWGNGWRNGYRQGFYDGLYAGGGVRNGRRVTYGPRLDRSAGAAAYTGNGARTTRASGDRAVAPGVGNTYQPASYGGYGGGGVSRATRAASAAPASNYQYQSAAPAPGASTYTNDATRKSREQISRSPGVTPAPNQPGYQQQPVRQQQPEYQQQPVRQQPAYQQQPEYQQQPVRQQPANQQQPEYQQQPVRQQPEYQQPVPDGRKQVQPLPAPASAPRNNWFQSTPRNSNESAPVRQSPRTYSPPARMESGGGIRGGGGGGNSGGGATRRSR